MEDKNFDEVINCLPENIKSIMQMLSVGIKQNTYEIRLRVEKPVVLFGNYGSRFLQKDSTVSSIDGRYGVCVSEDNMKQIISRICNYSVYSHQNDISNGFVTFGSGNRAGFCGTAVMKNNEITALRDITSINLRIARSFDNSADELLTKLGDKNSFSGIIIAGAPCTGKTTLLRSFAGSISSMCSFGFMKTVVIDERSEMGHCKGDNCDILKGFSKSDGINHAIRVLSPEIIICDEVSTVEEAEKIIKGCYSGVKFVVSVHIGTQQDLFVRPVSATLMNCGFFDYVAILSDSKNPGEIKKFEKTEDLKNEYYSNNNGYNQHSFCRLLHNSERNQALQNA